MIYLKAPRHKANGPDGQGWNRMAITFEPQDQCALRPSTKEAFLESLRGSSFATYGHYGACIKRGQCEACPLFRKAPLEMSAFDSRVMVRIDETGAPHLMNKPSQGWASRSINTTWERISRTKLFSAPVIGRDEHSEFIWIQIYPEPRQ